MWIINKQTASFSTTTSLSPPALCHHCYHQPPPPGAHNHHSTTPNHLNNDDNNAMPPSDEWQTASDNLADQQIRQWWHMSLPWFTVIEVSNVPVLPLFFSHLRSSGNVTNGDVANNNCQMTMSHGWTTTIHGQMMMTHKWTMILWHVNGHATSFRWWWQMLLSLFILIQVSDVYLFSSSFLTWETRAMAPMATLATWQPTSVKWWRHVDEYWWCTDRQWMLPQFMY